MARDRKLSDDLAALAAEQRSQLGAPPTAEELIACRDGKLSEVEVEWIRDRLAVDPEWAAIYLDLQHGSELELPEVAPGAVDRAWQALSAMLERDTPAVGARESGTGGEIVRRRPAWGPALLGLAAALVLCVGLIWLLTGRDRPHSASGEYQIVELTGERYRGARTIDVRQDVAGVEFRIEVGDLGPGTFVVELLDASDNLQVPRKVVEAGQKPIVLRVDSTAFVEGSTYRLIVRSPADSQEDEVLVEEVFQLSFEAREPGPAASAAATPCEDLKTDIDRARDLRDEGERRAAEALYHKTLESARGRNCHLQEARAWNGLGALAILEGRLIDSLHEFERAQGALDRSMPADRPAESRTSDHQAERLQATLEHNRGAAYLRLGWLDEARDSLLRARNLDRQHGAEPEDLASTQVQLARVHRLRGEPGLAAGEIREGLELPGDVKPNTRASLWQERARLELESGRFETAERALEAAVGELRGQGDEIARANLVADRAELELRRGRWAESLRWVQQALELADGAELDLNLEMHARYLQAAALGQIGEVKAAIRVADSGLALMESLRDAWRDLGLDFFAPRQKYYRQRLDLAVAAEDSADAWNVFESYRARGLVESWSTRLGGRPSRADKEELEDRRRALREAIRQLDAWDPAIGKEALLRREVVFRDRRQACHGARAAADDAFDGMAQHLLSRGVPAVVAMRTAISDTAAVSFAAVLYRALAAGSTIEAAVVAARRRLSLGRHRGEWATPALYLRRTNLRIFDPENGGVRRWVPRSFGRRELWLAGAAAVLVAAGLFFLAQFSAGPGPCPAPEGLQDLSFVEIGPGVVDLGAQKVTVDTAFCMATKEVSRRDWLEVMGGEIGRPDWPLDWPMTDVTPEDANAFLTQLEARDPGVTYRLPTAAEWEYAARAGGTGDYFFGDDSSTLHRYGNCKNFLRRDGHDGPAPIGSFLPNRWGLYDVHGNAAEWVEWPEDAGSALNDQGQEQAMRLGGSFENVPSNCGFGGGHSQVLADYDRQDTGFRIVRESTTGR